MDPRGRPIGLAPERWLSAERRGSLVRLLIALFVARIVVTVTEIIESEVTLWSALITPPSAWRLGARGE